VIKVFPKGDAWAWESDDGKRKGKGGFTEVVAEARAAAGVKVYDVVDPETQEKVGTHKTEADERVVLTDPSGEEIRGELEREPSPAGTGEQHHSLTPAETTDTARRRG
jgi:hypothetical protein